MCFSFFIHWPVVISDQLYRHRGTNTRCLRKNPICSSSSSSAPLFFFATAKIPSVKRHSILLTGLSVINIIIIIEKWMERFHKAYCSFIVKWSNSVRTPHITTRNTLFQGAEQMCASEHVPVSCVRTIAAYSTVRSTVAALYSIILH